MKEHSRLFAFAAWFAIAGLTLYLLVAGADLLIPIAIAVMLWYLLNALARNFGRFRPGGRELPLWLRLALAALLLGGALAALTEMISGRIQDATHAAPLYEANLQRVITDLAAFFGYEKIPTVAEMVERIDFGKLIRELAGTLTQVAGNAGIILIYVLFLLVEQGSFERKLKALLPDSDRQRRIRGLCSQIAEEIETYLWIKTVLSLATGALSYAVLALVGVDYAEFWAVVIFFLNYIPTIGSLLGIAFPALLALVQFDSIVPFLIVAPILSLVQIVIGNLIEPRMMGKSLNLSPFVIIVSLVLWGNVWGVTGMFLCVPITVIAMIVLSHFPHTRAIAVLLSSNGEISGAEKARTGCD